MSNYKNAEKGLKIMCIAAIGTFLCTFFVAIPFVGMLFQIGIIIFYVIDIAGYYYTGKDIVGCKIAFFFMLISLVLQVFHSFSRLFFNWFIGLFSLAALSLVFFSVSHMLCAFGAKELAKKGIVAWMIYLVSIVLKFILEMISSWLIMKEFENMEITSMMDFMIAKGDPVTTLVISLGSLGVTIVALIFRLKFYKVASEYLGKEIANK